MIIDIARLNPEGEDLVGEDPSDILEWDETEDLIHPAAPVHYKLHASITSGELLLRGSVKTRFEGICARCGGPLDLEVQDDEFCEFLPVTPDMQELDLTPYLRESILLALPSHPVCRPDCKGVCPQCGKRLAEGACDCARPAALGWEALSGLEVALNSKTGPKSKS